MSTLESLATRPMPDSRRNGFAHETNHKNLPLPKSLASCLPPEARLEEIAYVPSDSPSPEVLLQFPTPLQQMAVVVDRIAEPHQTVDLEMLCVPSDWADDEELLGEIRSWVDEAAARSGQTSLLLTFQQVQVFWSPVRAAVIAPSDRLSTVRKSLVEVTHYIAELNAIERDLGVLWPQLEQDTHLAFDYGKQAARKRAHLRQRFMQVHKLRAQLARVTPYLLSPHVYPPTLASQVGERLRERALVEQREDFLSDQLEVYEDMYDMCGQRANDYKHAQANNRLEWIIILLLVAQIVMTTVGALSIMEM